MKESGLAGQTKQLEPRDNRDKQVRQKSTEWAKKQTNRQTCSGNCRLKTENLQKQSTRPLSSYLDIA